MAAIPVRALTPTVVTGSIWKADPVLTGGTTNVTTIMGYGTGTGSRQVRPGTTNSTAASPPASPSTASSQGWLGTEVDHAEQSNAGATKPNRFLLSGPWTFVYSLAMTGGVTAVTAQMTVICYARNSSTLATRELFRNTSANLSIALVEANFTHTFTPSFTSNQLLNENERLLYEFWLNVSVNGNLTASNILFRAGDAGTALNRPSVTGGTIVAQWDKATSEAAGSSDAATRIATYPRAPAAELARASDTLARIFTGSRAPIAEVAKASDTVTRAVTFPRAPATEVAKASDTLTRIVTFNRATPEVAKASDTLARLFTGSRVVTDTAIASDSVFRVITYGRTVREYIGGPADYVIVFAFREIRGIVRDAAGLPKAGATVKLFRQSDDFMAQSMVSGVGGVYAFDRDKDDTNTYYTLSFLAGTPEVQGVSNRSLVPALK